MLVYEGHRSRSQEQKSFKKSLFQRCKTVIAHNSGSVRDTSIAHSSSLRVQWGSYGVTAIFVTRLEVTMHN